MTDYPEHIGVAMSGGVDSSMAATLLKDRGCRVAGFTMAHTGTPADAAAVSSARAVCAYLGIPHHALDLRQAFHDSVIRYFLDSYFQGLTPNPCVVCNRDIKFGLLLNSILAEGMDAMATGHYVITESDGARDRVILKKGRDPAKDQSYFLYRLTRDMLRRAVFPNGEYTKAEIKALAAEAGLPASAAGESQEICFVPGRDYGPFVAGAAPGRARQGRIVDTQGKLLGWHEGIHLYTVGQRRGLGVAAPEPLYVLRIEADTHTVVAAPDAALFAGELTTRDNSFVSGEPPESGAALHVKIRYNAPAVPAALYPEGDHGIRVVFDRPQRAITPGQSAVFYDGDTLLGGGIIQ